MKWARGAADSRYKLSEAERVKFEAHLPVVESGCTNWCGHVTMYGYGRISFWRNGRNVNFAAHRLRWALAFDVPKPDEMILHKCNNRRCVNLEHLYVGGNSENMRDSVAAGTGSRRKPMNKLHCKRGHSMTPGNTYYEHRRKPRCRQCRYMLRTSSAAALDAILEGRK